MKEVMNNVLQAMLGVGLISLIPIFGFVTLILSRKKLDKYLHLLVSFAVGALLGNAFLHLLPELIEEATNYRQLSIAIICGILLFYVIEQFLQWHHCHEQASREHTRPVGVMSQIGDTVHNFLDGVLIAGSFSINVELGWATVLAVMLHEIPQEIADFSVLLYAKWPVRKIIFVNMLTALAAFGGLLLGFIVNNSFSTFSQIAVAVTTGGFIYIACTDLIPDLHNNGGERIRERVLQLAVILVGVLLFAVI
jgi:zinc and cadmium transporter